MHQISKEFHFEYGHRVWSQKLNSKFSIDSKCVCRHCHGHSGMLKVGLESENLTNGMVTDFKHLNFFKQILDDDFDHKFIIDINDPLFDNLFGEVDKAKLIDKKFYKLPNLNDYKYLPEHIFEKIEGLVVVDFLPTSENLTRLFFNIVENKIKELDVKVSYIEFWETKKSYCKYTRD